MLQRLRRKASERTVEATRKCIATLPGDLPTGERANCIRGKG
jgi:hypothetical protein